MLTAITNIINVPPVSGGLPAEALPLQLLVGPVEAWLMLLGALALCGALLLFVTAAPLHGPGPRRRSRPARPATISPQRA